MISSRNVHSAGRSGIGTALAALLVFAWAPSAANPALIMLTLRLVHDHAHVVSLVDDEGHTDLVLADVESGDERDGREDAHAFRALSESEHVFHLASNDTTSAPRRTDAGTPIAALAVSMIALPFVSARPHLRPHPDLRASTADSLKSVVLRL